MLKRAVRRALGGRSQADQPRPTPARPPAKTAAPAPKPKSTGADPARPLSGIAARIAAGDVGDSAGRVKATSGAVGVSDTTITVAEDGTPFWGTMDNESARARADGQTLVIDQVECIACGTCVENTDVVFVLPDDAKATVLRQEGDMELVQDAIDACPVTCIHWSAEPAEYEQLNDALGQPPDPESR